MIFYVDGACSGNGTDNSSGAFGVVGINDADQMFYWFYDPTKETTNNREELKAILHVMRHFGMEDEVPIVYSDSAYSVNTSIPFANLSTNSFHLFPACPFIFCKSILYPC